MAGSNLRSGRRTGEGDRGGQLNRRRRQWH